MFCIECGKKDESNGNFCGYCGARMLYATGQAAATTGHETETPEQAVETTGHTAWMPGQAAATTGHETEIPRQAAEKTGHAAWMPGHAAATTGHETETPGQAAETTRQTAGMPEHETEIPGQAVETTGYAAGMPEHETGMTGQAADDDMRGEEIASVISAVLEPAPYAPPDAPKSATAHSKPKRGIALVILTAALCILLLICSMISAALLIIRKSINEQSVSAIVSGLNVEVLMERYDIYSTIEQHASQEELDYYGIDPATIERLLEQQFVQDYVSETISGYVDALLRGDPGHAISKNSIIRVLRRNAASIERVTGHSLTDENIASIEDYLDDSGILEEVSTGVILDSVQINPQMIRWPLSNLVVNASFVLCAAVLAGVLLLNRKYLHLALRDIGITIAIAGLLLTALGLSLYNVILTATGSAIGQVLTRNIFAQPRSAILLHGLSILAIGAVLTASGVLIGIVRKPRS